jgi:hypothetical protein
VTQDIELVAAKGVWLYEWGNSYLVSKAYKAFQGPAHPAPSFKWLWDSCCQKSTVGICCTID